MRRTSRLAFPRLLWGTWRGRAVLVAGRSRELSTPPREPRSRASQREPGAVPRYLPRQCLTRAGWTRNLQRSVARRRRPRPLERPPDLPPAPWTTATENPAEGDRREWRRALTRAAYGARNPCHPPRAAPRDRGRCRSSMHRRHGSSGPPFSYQSGPTWRTASPLGYRARGRFISRIVGRNDMDITRRIVSGVTQW